MIGQRYLVVQNEYNPYYNLALEEQLLWQMPKNAAMLYLWQNRHTVVIGRNQNAWLECKVRELTEDGGYVARRLSGGGAVYHDLGNLNFTFITDTEDFSVERNNRVILEALERLGINARVSGRNDMTIGDRKFSGHAYYRTKARAYHHGTLMVDCDLDNMTQYLQVGLDKLRAKGVSSIRSRVTNLAEHGRGLSVGTLKQALIGAFENAFGGRAEFFQYKPDQKLREKYASDEWRLGSQLPFDLVLSDRFAWGGAQICLQVQNGRISECRVYSDALEADEIARVAPRLTGCPFSRSEMIARLAETGIEKDLARLIQNSAI